MKKLDVEIFTRIFYILCWGRYVDKVGPVQQQAHTLDINDGPWKVLDRVLHQAGLYVLSEWLGIDVLAAPEKSLLGHVWQWYLGVRTSRGEKHSAQLLNDAFHTGSNVFCRTCVLKTSPRGGSNTLT